MASTTPTVGSWGKYPEITTNRIQAWKSGNLKDKFYDKDTVGPKELVVFHAPDRIPYTEAINATYKPTKIGVFEVPADWKGREVHMLWDSEGEALVWQDGTPVQAFNGGTGNDRRGEYVLTSAAQGGERYEFYIEMACNGMFGNSGWKIGPTPPEEKQYTLKQVELAKFNRDAWDLYWDFEMIADMAKHLPKESNRQGQAQYVANQLVNVINVDDRSTWPRARELAQRFFAAESGASEHEVSAIGHCHIDTAWLWPYSETQRKCARSWASQLRLMAAYPGYKFACSQAQQYEWVKQRYPRLFEEIRAAVRAGQFVPVGGTWVEMDCNIPSGESLARQFLIGQRFFRGEFGRYCREFWLPDTFGYAAQLPQLMRQAGIRYFLTQKLSWNQVNKFPHSSFWWRGIDGSAVLTHFPPADTYVAQVTAEELVKSVANHKDKGRANMSMLVFGHGDGGGGPTPAILERLRRAARNVDGLPKLVVQEPAAFFEGLEATAADLPEWCGELYFEYHRGTYTSQARNKLANRRAEGLLHNAELLAVVTAPKRAYPKDELLRLWKLVLLNQFHDVIPGTSIGMVYADSAAHYREVTDGGSRIVRESLEALFGPAPSPATSLVVMNTAGFARCEVVEVPAALVPGARQFAENGHALVMVSAPSMGYAVHSIATLGSAVPEVAVSLTSSEHEYVVSNGALRAVLCKDGHLASLQYTTGDGRAIEALSAAVRSNHFVLFDDLPLCWDAWDVDVYHLEKRYEVSGANSARVVENGPLRVTLEFAYRLTAASSMVQRISLAAGAEQLVFHTHVEWHEAHKFLKVEFATDIVSQQATYEIPFGWLARPTHFNTSWDMARFEVAAQKWADLSETGFGLAILNDCKYGHSVHGNVMRLSLLRAPKHPDADADMGSHDFAYALRPHRGSPHDANITQAAYAFNCPLLVVPSSATLEKSISYFSIDQPSVIIDTVKQAEDNNAIVVRLYEAHGGRVVARLSTALPVRAVYKCNLLEEQDEELKLVDSVVELRLRPFQIVTLKFLPA